MEEGLQFERNVRQFLPNGAGVGFSGKDEAGDTVEFIASEEALKSLVGLTGSLSREISEATFDSYEDRIRAAAHAVWSNSQDREQPYVVTDTDLEKVAL